MGNIAPKVKLTLPIIDEINVFSKLNLSAARKDQVPCFSDAVLDTHMCNPRVPKEGDEPVCAIHWACKVFLAGRLGLGLDPEEPYNFDKAKDFAKTLTYDQLVDAIREKVKGNEVDAEKALEESKKEAQTKDQEALAKKAATDPPKPKAAAKKTESKPKAPAVGAIGDFKPGSMGHFILTTVGDSTMSRDDVLAAVKEKGWQSEKSFDRTVTKLVEAAHLDFTDGHLKRK